MGNRSDLYPIDPCVGHEFEKLFKLPRTHCVIIIPLA
jgi:hypothetical protein